MEVFVFLIIAVVYIFMELIFQLLLLLALELFVTIVCIIIDLFCRVFLKRRYEYQFPHPEIWEPLGPGPPAKEAQPIQAESVATPIETAGKPQTVIKPQKPRPKKPPLTGFRLWTRRITLACVAITGISLVLLLAANYLFFDTVVRFVASRAAARAGISIDFENADGSLFTGNVRLTKMHVVRSGNPASDYDLRADDLDLKFAMSSILARERRLSRLAVHGINGSFERKGKQDDKPRKPFVIDHLTIGDANLDVIDQTPPGGIARMKLEIDSLRVDGYESEWAIWNLMFTSNAEGHIDGHPLSIKSALQGGENTAVWKADRVPAPLLVNYLSGPFQMLHDGYATVEVTSRWGAEQFPPVDLGWHIVFHDLKVKVPADAHPAMVLFSKPAVAYLNSHENRLPLAFHVVVDKRAFYGKTSLTTVGLWTDVRESASRTFEELVGAKFEVVVEKVNDLKDAVLQKAGPQLKKAGEVGKNAAHRLKGLLKRNKPEKNDEPGSKEPESASSEK